MNASRMTADSRGTQSVPTGPVVVEHVPREPVEVLAAGTGDSVAVQTAVVEGEAAAGLGGGEGVAEIRVRIVGFAFTVVGRLLPVLSAESYQDFATLGFHTPAHGGFVLGDFLLQLFLLFLLILFLLLFLLILFLLLQSQVHPLIHHCVDGVFFF